MHVRLCKSQGLRSYRISTFLEKSRGAHRPVKYRAPVHQQSILRPQSLHIAPGINRRCQFYKPDLLFGRRFLCNRASWSQHLGDQEDEPFWSKLCNQAMTLRDAGKTDDALKLLDRAVELADLESKSRPLSLRATTYIQIKQLDKAIEDLEAILRLNPGHVPTVSTVGDCYRMKKQYDLAKKFYDSTLSLDPKFVKALLGRAKLHIEQMEKEEALNDIKYALDKCNPTIAEYLELAHLLITLEKFEECEEVYKKVLRLEQDNVPALAGLGIIYYATARFNEAFDSYTAALKVKPSPDLYIKRATCFLEFSNFEKVVEDCDTALRLYEESRPRLPLDLTALYLVRGQAHIRLKNLEKAVDDLEKFTELASATFEVMQRQATSAELVAFHRNQLYEVHLQCVDALIKLHLQTKQEKQVPKSENQGELKQNDVNKALDDLKQAKDNSDLSAMPHLQRAVEHCIAAGVYRGFDKKIGNQATTLLSLIERALKRSVKSQLKATPSEDDLFKVLPK